MRRWHSSSVRRKKHLANVVGSGCREEVAIESPPAPFDFDPMTSTNSRSFGAYGVSRPRTISRHNLPRRTRALHHNCMSGCGGYGGGVSGAHAVCEFGRSASSTVSPQHRARRCLRGRGALQGFPAAARDARLRSRGTRIDGSGVRQVFPSRAIRHRWRSIAGPDAEPCAASKPAIARHSIRESLAARP